ncbi:hypothetical protein L227DRAFT_507419, partial [Lentinus tigrinus ALCF2SS1-6]
MNPADIKLPNVGPYALSEHACNTEFLRHEKWLLEMRQELLVLPVRRSQATTDVQIELLQTIHHELDRLQLHKQQEWIRQQQLEKVCEKRGELKEWLSRLLARPGLEDLMDTAARNVMEFAGGVMRDLWDAPVFREFLKDGRPFVLGPPGEGRYVFALYIDSFNPFQSKEAKQNVSVTGIYVVCLNLPPHLRYLPQNSLLVGIIP